MRIPGTKWRAASGEWRVTTCLAPRNSQLATPNSQLTTRGLTLIELLVVIVILVTLVAGVLPLLSPNNDSNKIQSASRSLQTYFQKAQTKAIRNGRPVGVMFREANAGDGYALEAYQVEVPPAFTGFSSASTAQFISNYDRVADGNGVYSLGSYSIVFGEGFGDTFIAGDLEFPAVPPRMVRVGDLIEVGSSVFRLGYNSRRELDLEYAEETGELFFNATNKFAKAYLVAGPSPPTAPISSNNFTFPSNYSVARQPVINNEAPLTFPKGVSVDMSASGTEGGTLTTLFAGTTPIVDSNTGERALKQIGIMFSPTGGVQDVYYNGYAVVAENGTLQQREITTTPITNIGQVMLLLSSVEKSGLNLTNNDSTSPWMMSAEASKEQVAESRDQVGWLSSDSRWITLKGRTNSIKVAENSLVDPRARSTTAKDAGTEALDQIQASRGRAALYKNLARADRAASAQ